ncbi:hypothetical protein AaE_014984 [Aphanomyces astaci]|uniref:Uncharacterized protein n=1 Tax=Aphanomyces astaci TaxID=112090 RepID=A0A6A4YZA0_APHAT|nr:hypothetical protein AaE_014984 [Aphanomyces astaci]
MKDAKRKRDYNRETRTCMLCGQSNVNYRKDNIIKHLIKHINDAHSQAIEWDGAKNPLLPRQYFEEREDVSLPCYIDEKSEPSEITTNQNGDVDVDGDDDFDAHLERLVSLPVSFYSEIIIRMLGSLCKQRGLSLPPVPTQAESTQTAVATEREVLKPTTRAKNDKVTKLLRSLGHV